MDEPGERVRNAFGVTGEGERFASGQGTAWRHGPIVLKPLDMTLDALTWQAEELPRLAADEFRVVPPIAAGDGSLVVDGWTAWPVAAGTHHPGRWTDIIAVGNSFHRALRGLPKPSFVTGRDDRWAVADQVAWGEVPVGPAVRSPLLNRLLAAMRPLEDPQPDQLVQGDLTGNVLFAPDLPPAIIDLSLYWRPPSYATAIVVTDAVAFEGAGPELADAGTPDFGQYLLRAIAFRLVTDRLAGTEAADADAPYLEISRLAHALT